MAAQRWQFLSNISASTINKDRLAQTMVLLEEIEMSCVRGPGSMVPLYAFQPKGAAFQQRTHSSHTWLWLGSVAPNLLSVLLLVCWIESNGIFG